MNRSEAKKLGLKRYTNGQPCPAGHIGERYTSSASCVDCIASREIPIEKQLEFKKRFKEKHPKISTLYGGRHRIKNPWSTLIYSAKARAKDKLPFNLTPDWARARWTGCCELSGLPFNLNFRNKDGLTSIYSPSLDRIDPSLGYIKSNCRFILHGLNAFKQKSTDEEMIKIMKAVLNV